MTCERARELITQRLVERDPAGAAELETHLAECEPCRAEAHAFARLWDSLGQLEEPAPSELLRARFEGMLDAYRSGVTPVPAPARKVVRLAEWAGRGWRQPLVRQLASVAAALLIGLGIGTYGVGAEAGQMAQLRSEVESLNQLVALTLLERGSASDRLQGVSYSQRLGRPGADMALALAGRVETDPNVNVRLAAVAALEPFVDDPRVVMLLASSLSSQPSPLVQIALVELLLESPGLEAERALSRLLEDETTQAEVRSYLRRRMGEET